MNDIETIKEMYREYWKCMIDKNEAGLREMMSADYYLMHMTGLMGGTFNYYSADHDDIRVSIYGNKATMTGKSRVLAAVYGGGRHRWRLCGDFTLKKENGDWKLTGSKASTY